MAIFLHDDGSPFLQCVISDTGADQGYLVCAVYSPCGFFDENPTLTNNPALFSSYYSQFDSSLGTPSITYHCDLSAAPYLPISAPSTSSEIVTVQLADFSSELFSIGLTSSLADWLPVFSVIFGVACILALLRK